MLTRLTPFWMRMPMQLAYSLLFTLMIPLLTLRLLWRSRLAPAYRQRLGERLGYFRLPVDSRPTLWIHAVSLGETIAARPLIERLLNEHSDYRLLVTTTTPTGSAQLRRLFGDRVAHVYAPWDTPGAVRRFLNRARPQLLVLMETELWPNMLRQAAGRGCRVLLANARLSARSAAGYARFARSTRRMLNCLHWVAAQSAADADRFLQLGLDPARLGVSGSIKFDIALSDELMQQAKELRTSWQLHERRVLIFASTHGGEDELALAAFAETRAAHSDAMLLLVPRHPERFDQVHALCESADWHVLRRSTGQSPDQETAIVLIDTLGELLLLYGVADLAVIGGSFIEHGGHNPLEAAVWGVPILSGPSMFNFAEVSRQLAEAGALEQVPDAEALASRLSELLGDVHELARRGAAAQSVITANRGAIDALYTALQRLLALR